MTRTHDQTGEHHGARHRDFIHFQSVGQIPNLIYENRKINILFSTCTLFKLAGFGSKGETLQNWFEVDLKVDSSSMLKSHAV